MLKLLLVILSCEIDVESPTDPVTTAPRTRNVLVLVADDLGIDKVESYCTHVGADLSCNRSAHTGLGHVPPTPHLNALAREGLRFTRAYGEPSCSPARAALITGRAGPDHGIGTVIQVDEQLLPDAGLHPDIVTIADVVPAGMRRMALGKWHLGGYEDFGLLGAPDLVPGDREDRDDLCDNEADPAACRAYDHRVIHHGFDAFVGRIRGQIAYNGWSRSSSDGQDRSAVWMMSSRDPREYFTTHITEEAIAFVTATDDPWLLYVGFQAPHAPWHVPPSPAELPGALHDPDTTAYSDVPGTYGIYGITQDQRNYGRMVQSMDHHIGRLLEVVDPENTTVVFVSDNGTPSEIIDPRYTQRGSLQAKLHHYDGGVVVPLIVRSPDLDPSRRGTTEDALVHHQDLLATIVALTGSDTAVPPGSDSLTQHFGPDPVMGRDTLLSSTWRSRGGSNNGGPPYTQCDFSLRTEGAKLLVDYRGVPELYLYDVGPPYAYEDYEVAFHPIEAPMGDRCRGEASRSLDRDAAAAYRRLRDALLLEHPGSCWVDSHEVNCCDDVDNDGDGRADAADPDCACDPDREVSPEACLAPPQ